MAMINSFIYIQEDCLMFPPSTSSHRPWALIGCPASGVPRGLTVAQGGGFPLLHLVKLDWLDY